MTTARIKGCVYPWRKCSATWDFIGAVRYLLEITVPLEVAPACSHSRRPRLAFADFLWNSALSSVASWKQLRDRPPWRSPLSLFLLDRAKCAPVLPAWSNRFPPLWPDSGSLLWLLKAQPTASVIDSRLTTLHVLPTFGRHRQSLIITHL